MDSKWGEIRVGVMWLLVLEEEVLDKLQAVDR